MSEAITTAAAYDLIDRFLRNNLYDDDYAKYSDALEALSQPAPSPQPAVPVVSDEQIDAVSLDQWGRTTAHHWQRTEPSPAPSSPCDRRLCR